VDEEADEERIADDRELKDQVMIMKGK